MTLEPIGNCVLLAPDLEPFLYDKKRNDFTTISVRVLSVLSFLPYPFCDTMIPALGQFQSGLWLFLEANKSVINIFKTCLEFPLFYSCYI